MVHPLSHMRLVRFQTILDIHESKLAYKLSVLLSWQCLRHAVGRHLVCRDPFHMKLLFPDLFTNPHLMDIDVLEFGVELVHLLCDNSNCLLIITP